MKYLRTYNENISYLTEPLDTEFETKIVDGTYDECYDFINNLGLQLKSLADKLGCDFDFKYKPINIKQHRESEFVIFEKNDEELEIRIKIISKDNDKFNISVFTEVFERTDFGTMDRYEINFYTIVDIEHRLRRILKINENQQYLTEPLDPDMDLIFEGDEHEYNEFVETLKGQLKNIVKKYNLQFDITHPNTHKYNAEWWRYYRDYIFNMSFNGNSWFYSLQKKYSSDKKDIILSYIPNMNTIGDIESDIVKKIEITY